MNKSKSRNDGRIQHDINKPYLLADILQSLLVCKPLQQGLQIHVRAQRTFYDLATEIAGQECPVSRPSEEIFCIKRNFFSTLFLAVTAQITTQRKFMPLYAMVNQGMRAWVTACDNILDDEYKEIFSFMFPEEGQCMRSVLTLLLADRVVSQFVTDTYEDKEIANEVARVSLRALVPCALQECGEEKRPVAILPSEQILRDIHKRKTADLFVAPLSLPMKLEEVEPCKAEAAEAALRFFGQACQIIDDIKDMPDDVSSGRHNLLVSMISEQCGESEWLGQIRSVDNWDWTAWERFNNVTVSATKMAMEQFENSFNSLSEIGLVLSKPQRSAVVACILALLKVPDSLVANDTEVFLG